MKKVQPAILIFILSSCFGAVEKPVIKISGMIESKSLDNGFNYHLFDTKNYKVEVRVSFQFMVDIGSFQENDD